MDTRLKHIEADRYDVIRQIEKQINLDDQIKKISHEINDLQRNTRATIEDIESFLLAKEKKISKALRPPPPRNLRAAPAAADHSCSITLTWENSYFNHGEQPITDYEVVYSVQDLECGTLLKRRSISMTCGLEDWSLANSIPIGSFVLRDLKAETLYTDIKIRCRNKEGWWSEFCSPVGSLITNKGKVFQLLNKIIDSSSNILTNFYALHHDTQTAPTRPNSPNSPQNFVAVVLSASHVRFKWEEPFCHNGNSSSVVGYDLIYHEKTTAEKQQQVASHEEDKKTRSHHQQSVDTNDSNIPPAFVKHHIRLSASETIFDLIDLKADTEYINISLATIGQDGLFSERVRCADIKTMSIIDSGVVGAAPPQNDIHIRKKQMNDCDECEYIHSNLGRLDRELQPSVRNEMEKGEETQHELLRREANFHLRINSLMNEINTCKSFIEENIEFRAKSVPKMIREQEIILAMKNELNRISDITDAFVQSSVLHGTEQKFCTLELRHILQEKLQTSASLIERLKAENISKEHLSRELAKTIEQKESMLKERKSALMMFRKQVKSASLISLQLPGTSDVLKRTFYAWNSHVTRSRDIQAAFKAIKVWNDKKCLNKSILRWRDVAKYYSRIEQMRKGESHVISKGGACLIRSELSRLEVRNQIINEIIDISKKSLTSIEDKTFLEKHLLAYCEETFLLIKGDYHYHLEEYNDALRCYLDAMEFVMRYDLNAFDKMKLRCTLLNKIGRSAFATNDINRAILAFDELLVIAKKLEHNAFKFTASLGLGKCYALTQEWSLAEKYSTYCSSSRLVIGLPLELYDESIKLLHKACQFRDAKHADCRFLYSKNCSTSKEISVSLEKLNKIHVRIKNNAIYFGYGIQLKRATSRCVKLNLRKQTLEADLEAMILKLEANDHQLQYLSGLITKINHELRIEGFYRRESDSYRRISSLVHDNIQSVDANELSKRLNIRLEDSKATHREARNVHQEIEIMIRNLKDELEDVRKEHELETCQLATKNLLNHRIRLMVFNSLLESGDSTGENVDNVSTLVAITVGKDIFIYDSSTGDPTQVFEGDALYGESSRMKGHSSIITSIFFQGKIVFSGAMDAKLCAWDVLSGKLLYVANGHDSTVTCIVCDTGGVDNIISGSVDKTLIVWRKYDGVQLHRLSGHSRGILSLDQAYGTIVSGDADGEIFLWDTKQVSNYIAMISS